MWFVEISILTDNVNKPENPSNHFASCGGFSLAQIIYDSTHIHSLFTKRQNHVGYTTRCKHGGHYLKHKLTRSILALKANHVVQVNKLNK